QVGYTMLPYGAWRSPVARLHGVQEAPGSNPGAPTGKPLLTEVAFLYWLDLLNLVFCEQVSKVSIPAPLQELVNDHFEGVKHEKTQVISGGLVPGPARNSGNSGHRPGCWPW